MNMRMKSVCVIFSVVSSLALPSGAVDVRWTGEGDTAAWSDGGNWDGGVAPGAGDTAVIPQGKTALWAQTDAAFMDALSGIKLNGEMEVSGMSAKTTLTVPLSGGGVFRGLEGGEKATGVSSGTYYYLTLNNDNSNFTGTFAFTNCGVCAKNNLAFGGAATRCTLIWKNATSGNHRRLYLESSGHYHANMFLSQPDYGIGMVFATCAAETFIDGDVDLIGAAAFNANNRSCGFHISGKLTNSAKCAYRLEPYVHLDGEVDLRWNNANQFGGGFYLGGGNGNVKNMGRLYVNSSGIHFSAPNVIDGGSDGGVCYRISGNNTSLRLYLDGYDQNWYRKPYNQGFIVDSTKPATIRMMNYNSGNLTYNTANCLTGYASFDVCATNASGTKYTTTLKTTHCTTAGGLLCGAGTFVVGDSAADGVTTSFSNLTSLITYETGKMNVYNTAINPENGVTNLSVLGTSAMTLNAGVAFATVDAHLSSTATLNIASGSTVVASHRAHLDGDVLPMGVYGKKNGTYADGSPIPPAYQLDCLTGDGYMDVQGPKGMMLILK